MTIIETFNLTKRFGPQVAVEDLTLKVERGEVFGFLGPNGGGKTTTIRILSGIISPSSGHAVVAGYRTDRQVELLHEKIGLLTEVPGFYDRLSAWQNLEFYARFYRRLSKNPAVRVEQSLRLVDLWDRRGERVGRFSKGMKQRLALARALLPESEVLFLDEPTAGLDPENAEEIRALVARLGAEGKTIFLSTHNLAEAERLCHRIAIIRTRLIAMDRPENLRKLLHSFTVVIELEEITVAVLEAMGRMPFVKDWQQQGRRLVIQLDGTGKELPDLVREIVQSGGKIIRVMEKERSLEQVYLNLMRGKEKRR